MLNLAHVAPAGPEGVWRSWATDPVVCLGLAVAALAYLRGGRVRRARMGGRWRSAASTAGLVALAVALVSPLDAMSGALASAHMVQHLLLVAVAAPLLVAGNTSATIAAGLPRRLTTMRPVRRGRRALRSARRFTGDPLATAALHVATVWFWHAGAPYDAAVHHDVLHAVEHLSFLATAVLAWHAALRAGGTGASVLALFALSVQGALLGALLTFAPSPWYAEYAGTTSAWGLTRLADQHLAGAVMWVAGGIPYLAAALWLVSRWVGDDRAETAGRSSYRYRET